MPDESSGSGVKATETSLGIVQALYDLEGGRINELAEYLDLAPSTVHRHLSTLRKRDYVTKEGDTYVLGMQFLTIGGYIQSREYGYRLAKTQVEQLAAQTDERAQFMVEENGQRIYIHTASGEHAVQTDAYIGKRGCLHCSAGGKAILAHLPERRIEEIIEQWGLPPVTENTITNRENLFEQLRQIQKREVAFNYEESTARLNAVGTAVERPDGRVLGALSVAAPAHRLKGTRFKEEIPDLVLGVANELELNVEYAKR